MSPVTRATLILTAMVLLAPLAAADTLLHRQPPGRTFGISSDTEYLDDFNRPTGALIADKFNLAPGVDTCVARVTAFAFFGGTGVVDPGPPATETIRVRLLADVAGLPAEPPLYEAYFQDPARVWTGFLINIAGARKEYRYELPLPHCFEAVPGTDYWLEVAQMGDINSLFRWEHSNTAGGFAVQFPLETPWRLSANPSQLAYELWTPEPCSGALLALGLALCLRRPARGGPEASDKLGRNGV
jgi:hypothetical protein